MPSPSYPHAAPPRSYVDSGTSSIVHNIYIGIHPDGRIRVAINNDKALVSGIVYVLGEKRCADGTAKKTRRHIHTTPGYQVGAADETGFLAAGRKTSRPYRIIGRVEYCSPPPSMPPQQPSSHEVVAATATKSTGAAANDAMLLEKEQQQQQRTERRGKALQREHAAVMAQRSLGLDPLISIAYLSHTSGRSISTLYRAFGKTLPQPVKVGGRSRIPYSAAKAYMTARGFIDMAVVESGHAGTTAFDKTVEGSVPDALVAPTPASTPLLL